MSYTTSPSRRASLIVGILVGALAIGAVGLFCWVWGLNILHMFTTSWREGAIFWTPIFGAAALVAIAYGVRRHSRILVAALCSAGGLLVLFALIMTPAASFTRLNIYYTQSTQQLSSVAPDYTDRVPYEVADNTSDAVMQDLTGDALNVKALSDTGDHGLWTTLVLTRGPFNGYEAVQSMDLPLFDSNDSSRGVSNCTFADNATLRDSGSLPHNNLSRAVYGMVPLDVDFSASDIYGYCDETTPIVVVPLYQVQGWLWPINVFYGVAVYDGSTGALRVVTQADALAKIPGPIYPQSLAATQRASLSASKDWWSYVVGTSGFTAATSNTEVQLREESKADTIEGDYVTTLTPRGSSKSIVGVSVVDATNAVPGQLNTLTVNLLPNGESRASNAALEQTLRGRYSQIPDIATDKLQVFEVTSSTKGSWVMTLGRELSVSYRAYISADGTEITLVNRNGDVVAQNYDVEGAGTEGELVPTTGSLRDMTDEQLRQLGVDILEELERRAGS